MALNWHTCLALAAFAALWWLLSDGDANSWIIGVPAVVAAVWSASRTGTGDSRMLSLTGLLRFIPFFVWESLRGGVDVALRTLSPRMRIEPAFVAYNTALQNQSARAFFASCVNLLPGTLAADIIDDRLDLHLLDRKSDYARELRRLETAVARVYPDAAAASEASLARDHELSGDREEVNTK
jgi:multicomponent Na+:H+ antiporter subunit E